MNCPMVDKPSDFPLNGDIETEIRYAELCNRLRPPPLMVASPHPAALETLKRRMVLAPEHESSSTKSETSTSSKSVATPSQTDEKADASEARLILRLASLDVSDPYVIPEGRICTPRTPRTPANLSSHSRRTVSPVDECRGGATTPKDLLIQRYKGLTPRHSDFVNIM